MLVDLNRRIFKITAFFCVVVSVFSDGRMGFYRGAAGDVSGPDALLCPAFACMVCAVRGVAVVLFAGGCRCVFAVRPGGVFFSAGGGGGGCCLRHTAGRRFAVLWRKCGYAMGICCGGMVVAVARISGDVWMPGSRERFAGLSRR